MRAAIYMMITYFWSFLKVFQHVELAHFTNLQGGRCVTPDLIYLCGLVTIQRWPSTKCPKNPHPLCTRRSGCFCVTVYFSTCDSPIFFKITAYDSVGYTHSDSLSWQLKIILAAERTVAVRQIFHSLCNIGMLISWLTSHQQTS